jgi:hypothetical protein
MISSYTAGTTYTIVVTFTWNSSPIRDFTVRVYSPFTANIKDSTGSTKTTNYDGTSPSSFTSSSYTGMTCSSSSSVAGSSSNT